MPQYSLDMQKLFPIPKARKDEFVVTTLTLLLIACFGRIEDREKWLENKIFDLQLVGEERRCFYFQLGIAISRTDIINFCHNTVLGVFGTTNDIAVFSERNEEKIKEIIQKFTKVNMTYGN